MKRFFCCMLLLAAGFFPVVSSAQGNSLSDIQTAIIQEDYKKAGDLAKDLLKTKPSGNELAQARYYLALSDLRQGNYPQAYEMFRKVVDSRPAADIFEKATVGVIDALYMRGDYESALNEATQFMNKHRKAEDMSLIYLKAARSNLKLARWNKAKEFLEKIVVEYPNSFECGVARQLLEEKQYFTVQVGAFVEQARAERLVQELMRQKEYAYVVETKSPDGKNYYRVRVGQLAALKDAQALESRLSGSGYPTRIYP